MQFEEVGRRGNTFAGGIFYQSPEASPALAINDQSFHVAFPSPFFSPSFFTYLVHLSR